MGDQQEKAITLGETESRKHMETSFEWAKKLDSIVCKRDEIQVNVQDNSGKTYAVKVAADTVYASAVGGVADLLNGSGGNRERVAEFLLNVVADSPDTLYHAAGVPMFEMFARAGEIGLSSEAKAAGAIFEQVVAYKGVMEAGRRG